MPTKKNQNPGAKTNIAPPVQLSIWDVLEYPEFEKNLVQEMNLLNYAGANYSKLKEQIEQQYRKDIETLNLARDNSMKELLKQYPKPEDLTIKYVEIITKKSRLSAHKRELIQQLFGGIVKSTAIDIVNKKAENKECAESSSQKDLN